MPAVLPYNRTAAVAYAHRWAYGRNPAYYNYDDLGGDCTNFASQCLYAGTGVMNDTPTFGWYYYNGNDKAPAWTGVPYFYQFLTREEATPGPFAVDITRSLERLQPGDFVQMRFSADRFGHTPVVVDIAGPPTLRNILVAAHTDDADYRPLTTYYFQEIRFLHILGAYSDPDSAPAVSAGTAGKNLYIPVMGHFRNGLS